MSRRHIIALVLSGLLLVAAYLPFSDLYELPAYTYIPIPAREGWFAIQREGRPHFERTDMRFQEGDDARWSRPDWDDSGWRLIAPFDVPSRAGVFWLRWRVRPAEPGATLPPGINVTTVAAYEIFWDGELLGRNGMPGDSAARETPGRIDQIFPLTLAQAGPGEHVIAMRVSTHRCGFSNPRSGVLVHLESAVELYRYRAGNAVIPTLAAGAMFVLALICGLLWLFGPRRGELAWAMVLCAAASVMQALPVIRWLQNYPSDLYHWVIKGGAALHAIMAVSLIAVIARHLAVPRLRWLLAGSTVAMALIAAVTPPVRNTEGAYMMLAACAVVMAIGAWAARPGRRGPWFVVVGALITGLWIAVEPRGYTWTGFLPRFLPMLAGATIMLAATARREFEESERTRQMAARLELELLKKNLQPHFLLNTLTALTELVEQRPADAVGLIEDLAAEFRLIASMATERTVPLAQELTLCRTHLRVLGVRTGREYRLETQGIDDDARVPPAVFLTLIENAFSHQHAAASPAVFRLTGETDASGAMRYRFLSPGEISPLKAKTGGGTGLRYVRARLEECFPQKWSLLDGATTEGWQTCITIPRMEASP